MQKNPDVEPLIKAAVDRQKVGGEWPAGIVQLIEAHERKYRYMATRKNVHVLMDRYIAEYFPDVSLEYQHRHAIISALRARHFVRFNWLLRNLMAQGSGQT